MTFAECQIFKSFKQVPEGERCPSVDLVVQFLFWMQPSTSSFSVSRNECSLDCSCCTSLCSCGYALSQRRFSYSDSHTASSFASFFQNADLSAATNLFLSCSSDSSFKKRTIANFTATPMESTLYRIDFTNSIGSGSDP